MAKTFSNHRFKPGPPSRPAPKTVQKQHPNIEAIFMKRYRVKMYADDIMSIEEQRMFGMPATGHKDIDKAARNERRTLLMTINEMVEHYREGTQVFLTQLEDASSIYDAVVAHTGVWRGALLYAMNMGNAPVEDLILMEQFVATVYKHAKFEQEKESLGNVGTSSLAKFLYGRDVQMGGLTINGKVNTSEGMRHGQDVRDLQHVPDTDVFKRALIANAGKKQNDDE